MIRVLLVAALFASIAAAQPAVVNVSPQTNVGNAARGSDISATFNMPMSGASQSNFPVYSSQRGRRQGAYSGTGTATLTFNSAQDFYPGEVVSATLTSGLQSTGAVALGQPRVWQFTAAAGAGPHYFNYKAPFTGFAGNSEGLRSLAAGDLDGDGDLDWVTGFSNSNQCCVHLNNGNGTFPYNPQTLWLAGVCAQCVGLADVERDGDLDILLGCEGLSNQNYIWINDGAGNFSSYLLFGTGSDASTWIGCADMDADGDVDIVCGNGGQQSFIYLNNGAGSFGGSIAFGSPTGVVVGAALGDVDSDGDIDLVSVTGTGTFSTWFNNGSGTFGTPSDTTYAGASFAGCTLADFDGDQDLDLALANYNGANPVYTNTGAGVFSSAGTASADSQATNSMLSGDFDGDGDIDLVAFNTGSPGTNQTYLYLNNGSVSFSRDAAAGTATDRTACGVAADFDGDGDLDLVLGRINGGVHEIRYNASQQPVVSNASLPAAQQGVNYSVQLTASGGTPPYSWNLVSAPAWLSLGAVSGLLTGTPPMGIAPAQFSVTIRVFDSLSEFSDWIQTLDVFDGSPTITTTSLTNAQESSTYSFTLTAVQGQAPYSWSLVSAPAWLSIGAASGMLTGTPPAGSGGSSVNVTARVTDALSQFKNKTLPLFIDLPGPPALLVTNPASNSNGALPTDYVSATFDKAMAAPPASGFVVHSSMKGRRTGSLYGGGTNTLGLVPQSLFKPGETVEVTLTTALTSTASQSLPSAHVYRFRTASAAASANLSLRNSGLGTSAEVTLDVAVGDIDGDGFVDIVQGNGAGTMRACYWYRNNGDGTFTTRFQLGTLDNIHAVLLVDLDNDGDLDFVQGSMGGQTAAFLNNGTGQFSGAYVIANSGNQVLSLAAGDIDGDGDLDILSGESILTVYRNNGGGSFTAFEYMNIYNAKALALADFDADGDLDCVAVGDGQDQFFLNDGTGDFASPGTALGAAATASRGVYAADFDADGDADIIVSANNAPTYVYFNNGSAAFTQGAAIGTGGATAMACADFDGDGDLDFIEGRNGAACAILINNGAGVFNAGTPFGVASQHCDSLACADFDGDGKIDIVSGNNDAAIAEQSYVYLNDAALTVTGTLAAGAGNPAAQVVVPGSIRTALHAVIGNNAASAASAVITGFNVQLAITGGTSAFAQIASVRLWRGNALPTLGGTLLETVQRNASGWNENVATGQATVTFGVVAAINETVVPGASGDYWIQIEFSSASSSGQLFTYAASLDQSLGAGLIGSNTAGIIGTVQGGVMSMTGTSGGQSDGGDDGGCTTHDSTGAGWIALLVSALLFKRRRHREMA